MQRDPYLLTQQANARTAQRLGGVRTMVVLWLIVLALAVALIPLIILSGWVRGESARLQSELAQVQTQIEAAGQPAAEVVRLEETAAANEALIQALQAVTVPVGLDWPRVVAALAGYDPLLVRLTALSQRDQRIRVAGRAVSNDAVIRYEQRLLDADVFSSVVILSQIAAPTPPPAATPARTPAPGGPTPTPTPFGSIDFEIDLVVRMPVAEQAP